jgi:hypothetical protein
MHWKDSVGLNEQNCWVQLWQCHVFAKRTYPGQLNCSILFSFWMNIDKTGTWKTWNWFSCTYWSLCLECLSLILPGEIDWSLSQRFPHLWFLPCFQMGASSMKWIITGWIFGDVCLSTIREPCLIDSAIHTYATWPIRCPQASKVIIIM